MSRTLELVPLNQRAARAFVAEHHRHNGPDRGDIFRVGLAVDGDIIAIASAGRPNAPALQDGRTIEITRVCTLGHDNACSRLYGALCRAAAAGGSVSGDGDRTVLRLSVVVAELREHAAHCDLGAENCGRCKLWLIYTRGTRRDLDAFIENATVPALYEDAALVLRAIRSEWGEGDWTAGDIG